MNLIINPIVIMELEIYVARQGKIKLIILKVSKWDPRNL